MKSYYFLNGAKIQVADDTCRGCYLENNEEQLPSENRLIAQTEYCSIRQDAEIPIPAFFIISTRRHVNSICDLSFPEYEDLYKCVVRVRTFMRDIIGLPRVHIYLEERKIDPHVHVWLLPIWEAKVESLGMHPKIWENNIRTYLSLFDYDSEAPRIMEYNQMLKDYL